MNATQQSIEATLDRLEERDRLRAKLTPYLLEQGTWTVEHIECIPLASLRAMDNIKTRLDDFRARTRDYMDTLDALAGCKGGEFFDCPQDDEERDSDGEAYRDESRD